MSIWAKTWAYKQHPKRVEKDSDGAEFVAGKKHPAAKAVLVALAEYPGPGERHCWPSQNTLAGMTDMTDRQVRRCMADLEFQGLIHREEQRRKDGTRRSDTITLLGPIEEFGPAEGQPDERSGRQPYQPDESDTPTGRERPHQPDESSGHEPPQRTAIEPSSEKETSSFSGETPVSQPPSPQSGLPSEEKVTTKQYGIRRLVELRNEAVSNGEEPAPLDEPYKRRHGDIYAAHLSDGFEADDLEPALKHLIECACGRGSGWLEGKKRWIPLVDAIAHAQEQPVSQKPGPEDDRLREENRRESLRLLYGDGNPLGKVG